MSAFDKKKLDGLKSVYGFEYLVVGGGGGGSQYGNGAGGGGAVCLGCAFTLANYINIIIGCGGIGTTYSNCNATTQHGGDSCIETALVKVIANGGAGGNLTNKNGGAGYSGSGYPGRANNVSSGGGGAGGAGVCCSSSCCVGGAGICGYGGGAGGGASGIGRDGGGNGVSGCKAGCPGTNYGGGGSGPGYYTYKGGNGCQGVVDICYPINGDYGFTCATGGNCCYTCNGYCVHRFTSNGTFTITG